VQARALVTGGDVGEAVRGFEGELAKDLHSERMLGAGSALRRRRSDRNPRLRKDTEPHVHATERRDSPFRGALC